MASLRGRWRRGGAQLLAIARRLKEQQRRVTARGALATEDDVRFAYRLLLGREADPAGLASWTAQLGTMTAAELGRHFVRSAEYRQRWLAGLGERLELELPARTVPTSRPLASQLVTQAQIDSAHYWRWCEEMAELPTYHRKQWEYVYLLEALDQAGMLCEGARGLGFGVGREPTVSVLARRGCDLLVTDLPPDAAERDGWRGSGQHASTLDDLRHAAICDRETFRARVRQRPQDMRAIDADLRAGGFDFVWSLCALEHLGSLDEGLRFVRASLGCVRPGGLAVHTTEFNVSSDDATISEGVTVLYRRRDLEALARDLARDGHEMHLDLHPGEGLLDRYYDLPPYRSEVHLKARLASFVTTSVGLVIRKAR